MIIKHRSRFSATAVLCGVSIFVYPAIAWGQRCAPATVNTGATLVSDQLLEQLRQRREQQATVSMFSTTGSSVVNVSTAPTAAGTATTPPHGARCQDPARVRRHKGNQRAPFFDEVPQGSRQGGRHDGMSKRRPLQDPARVRSPPNSMSLRAIRMAGTP